MLWNKNYEIGVSEVDNQHKKLFGIIEKMENALKEGRIDQEVGAIFKELVDYTKYHFKSEEEVMKKYGYPHLEKHKKLHAQLINEIKKLLLQLKEGKAVTIELFKLVKTWIVNHVLKEDLKIRSFING